MKIAANKKISVDIELPELEQWIKSLRNQDCSESTLREYHRDAQQCLSWIKDLTPNKPLCITSVTTTTVREFRKHLLDKKLAPNTINRIIGTMSQFFCWLELPKSKNPFCAIKRIEIEESSPKSLTRNEWNTIRRGAETWIKHDNGIALAVVVLCRHAGLRAGEVANLSISDVDITERSGRVIIRQGKGLKHRIVPLILEAREGIEPWLSARQEICKKLSKKYFEMGVPIPSWAEIESGSFLFGQRGSFTTRGIAHITQKLGKFAGFKEPLGPHALRHTFAKSALDPKSYALTHAPLPLPALQQMLGHCRIDTTSIYTKFSIEEMASLLNCEEKEIQ